jgi:hypothetical protein
VTTPFEVVCDALEQQGARPKRSGDHVVAHCPAHHDSTPSLTVDVGDDGRALVYCFAGCPTQEVVRLLGLTMADLFEKTGFRSGPRAERPRGRPPAGPLDRTYSIVPRFVTESCDPSCVRLYSYLDLHQGDRGRIARGDQVIADALRCQARTVREHALHLAGAGYVLVRKQTTKTGAHLVTEYDVVHNPARKRVNETATTPLRKPRAKPLSRYSSAKGVAPDPSSSTERDSRDVPTESIARKTRDSPSGSVARKTRDSPVPSPVRKTREQDNDVGRGTPDALGTQEGNKETRYSEGNQYHATSRDQNLDLEGGIADAPVEPLDQAAPPVAPFYNDADLEGLFAVDADGWDDGAEPEVAEPLSAATSMKEAFSLLLSAFPGATFVGGGTRGSTR